MATESFFEQPMLESPYEYPLRHCKLDESGRPTNPVVVETTTGFVR